MIPFQTEEAACFDVLSILEIKLDKFPDSKVVRDNYYRTYDDLENLLGQQKFRDIISSFEYEDLKNVNILTFNAVDKARNNEEITAKEVDSLNMERFYAKKALQKKFFTEELKEFKN
jgi:hypothetical protein